MLLIIDIYSEKTRLSRDGRHEFSFHSQVIRPYNTKFFAHIGRLPVSGAVFGINTFE